MLKYTLLFCLIFLFSCQNKPADPVVESTPKEIPIALVLHGGAGVIKKEYMTPEKEQAYKEKIREALEVGYSMLENGSTSLDAIQATINVLEDSPLFNAGKGSVFNSEGKQEMDASIMDGKTLNAGAIAGVHHIKNPINAARLVMDSIEHVMLSGNRAEEFAKKYGIQMEDESYFFDENRFQSLQKIKAEESGDSLKVALLTNQNNYIDEHKKGTVGAVALDKYGNIAAGTSTGGMTNKKYGRIGDAPIIGAGTYANNLSCGISCTGTGEYFIRTVAANQVSNLMLYQKSTLAQAMEQVIHKAIDSLGGDGGMIGIDRQGNVAWDFNSEGMFRGYKTSASSDPFVIEFYEKGTRIK